MIVLGLSGSTHDSSACILVDGVLVAAIEQERLSRIRHAPFVVPLDAATEVCRIAGVSAERINLVAYFIDPTVFARGVMPHILLREPNKYILQYRRYQTGRFLRRGARYRRQATELVRAMGIRAPIRFVRHHEAHAASAFLLSPFDQAMIMTLDNMGELDSTLLASGAGSMITVRSRQYVPHSLGMLYAAVTNYLGFAPWRDEGKVMALAAYGSPAVPPEAVVSLRAKGRFRVSPPFRMVQTSARDKVYDAGLVRLLGPARAPSEPIEQRHKDIAASLQLATERVAIHLLEWLHHETGLRALCVAGGVALNCRMNGVLARHGCLEDMYVFPAAGDAGTSVGAAALAAVASGERRPAPLLRPDLGPTYERSRIEQAVDDARLAWRHSPHVASEAAGRIVAERVICWFQGRSEFGPRALGHRSILALPSSVRIRDYVNRDVKHREDWRPLAPAILAGDASRYFEASTHMRFMNVACQATDMARARLSGVIHADGTARVQIVFEDDQPLFAELLREVGRLTGDPVLLNTSFNSPGEPMVETPEDAVRAFQSMPVETLVIGEYVVTKGQDARSIWR